MDSYSIYDWSFLCLVFAQLLTHYTVLCALERLLEVVELPNYVLSRFWWCFYFCFLMSYIFYYGSRFLDIN